MQHEIHVLAFGKFSRFLRGFVAWNSKVFIASREVWIYFYNVPYNIEKFRYISSISNGQVDISTQKKSKKVKIEFYSNFHA